MGAGALFLFRRAMMLLTLCHDCAQPFFDDRNYIIAVLPIDYSIVRDRCDIECFICGKRGREYDVEKMPKRYSASCHDCGGRA